MDELLAAEGEDLGMSDWLEVTQPLIDAFAQATGDTYWIHTDPERTAAGPLGSTIAHGLYTLSLGPMFFDSLVTFEDFSVVGTSSAWAPTRKALTRSCRSRQKR
ncbi:MAG: hypothetical protein JO372_15990 [Solirubrobacterales bacterium]|nr:hypothetical protein [Solirubrobacterales bacterium]